MITILVLALLNVPTISAGQQQTADRFAVAGTTEEEAAAFLEALQSALAESDGRALAALAGYPMRLNLAQGNTTVGSPEEFRALLDVIFPPQSRKVILAETPDDLFVNWQGVMIGSGQVWFGVVEEGGREVLRIIAVNRIER